MLTTTSNYDFADSLQSKAKLNLIDMILRDCEGFMKGSQIMELNKILNKTLEEYEVFIQQNIDHDENYQEKNREILDKYIRIKKLEGLSKESLKVYDKIMSDLLKWLSCSLVNVDVDTIRNYLEWYREKGTCSNITLDNIRRILNAFFNWCAEERLIPFNPMMTIKRIKTPKTVKKPYTEDEVELMRRTLILSDTWMEDTKVKYMAVFELLLSSGIRVRELHNLNISDLDFTRRSMVVKGKGAKERICYFSTKAKQFIKSYLETRTDDNEALFINKRKERLGVHGIGRFLRDLGNECGVKAHPHKFRRTFATDLLKKGAGIEKVKTLLGHANMDTTLIYAMMDDYDIRQTHNQFIGY
ncbi:site-specific tyrosine recombinase/integron integrase [uncultured Methanobrevibacter sp.]|uniref:site-specific tyrosine recombinase/integron integrase n=1 Tax=uncultured Methanobrevibacter sp. TaxID=253161 RepID=UPI0015B8C75A|nr:site-specific tyrosine recombinase/integron integrase [uncultured Methanobrevibacter sp.]